MILLLLHLINASSQEANLQLKAFQTSIISIITSSPSGFGTDCKSKIFMLKITLLEDAKDTRITLSDSLDSLYKNYFIDNPSKIDTKALTNWVKSKNYVSNTLVVGIHYIVKGDDCPSPMLEDVNLSKLNRFNGLEFTGECILLPPIFLRAKKSY